MSEQPSKGRPRDPEEEIVEACLARPIEERAGYLDRVCAGDAALRRRVEELLRSHSLAESFLEEPPVSVGAGQTSKSDVPLAEKVGDHIGRYKLLQQIGEGGCGVVYMAEQQEPVRRRVALKIIKLGMDTKNVIARFEAERQALAMMDHPNIAKVLEAGATDKGRPYFVMELVRGLKMTDYCDKNNLPTRERLLLFVQVCQAIQHAHQKGIIHRDIKPSNILVTLRDGVPVPKVIDFGIAKATTDQRLTDKTLFTAFEQFIGTPTYMSPEQAEMSELGLDTRSDIYSLGVLLYELLTGQTPFDSDLLLRSGLDEIRRIIREEEPVRPSTRLSTMLAGALTTTAQRRQAEPAKLSGLMRGDLDWIVMKCLEKDRARRYETVNGLGMDIQRHLQNEPVVARPPSLAYILQKALRRHKLAFGALSGIAVSLMIGLGLSTWLYLQERKERHRAVTAEQRESHLLRDVQSAQTNEVRLRRAAEAQERAARQSAYVSDMIAASQALNDRNFNIAKQLLAGQVPHSGEEDLRTFEWRYLWNQSQGEQLKTLLGHSGAVNCVAYAPDGRILASGSFDHTIKLWNAATGDLIRTCAGHSANVVSLAFSKDGRILASAAEDGLILFWDVRTWNITSTLTNSLPRVAFSGNVLAIATGNGHRVNSWGEVELWDYTAGRLLKRLPGSGNRAAFAPDGKMIATANGNGLVRLWDVATGTELRTFACARVHSLAFSPDGRMLAWSAQNRIWLWELSQAQPAKLASSTQGVIYAIAFSPDGQTIASADQYHTLTLWNVAHAKEFVKLQGHGGGVWDVAFSPDGKTLASGAQDNAVMLWNPLSSEANQEITNVLQSRYFAGSPIFSPDGKTLAYASVHGGLLLSEVATGRVARRLETDDLPVVFSSDGLSLFTWDRSYGALQRWSLDTGMPQGTTQLAVIRTNQYACDFSSAANLMAASDKRNHVILRSMTTGKELFTLQLPSSAHVMSFSPSNGYLATGHWDGSAEVWDLTTRHPVFVFDRFDETVDNVAFSSDGSLLAAGSFDGTVKVVDVPARKQLTTLIGNKSSVIAVAFSGDGRTIATGGDDNTVRLWNLASGREVLRFETATPAYLVKFSSDGQTLAFGGGDRIIHLRRAPSIEEIDASDHAQTLSAPAP
jgi:WD40 repeat protein/serine/threonine protein kinase